MKKSETTTYTTFTQVQLYKGTESVASYSANHFETYEEAVKDWEVNCRDRNKGNEYDAYWNAVPCVILEETKTRTLIFKETV